MERKIVIAGQTDDEKARVAARDEQVLRLAEKLGVQPLAQGEDAIVTFVLADGRRFSWPDLIFAHLAAMENALV